MDQTDLYKDGVDIYKVYLQFTYSGLAQLSLLKGDINQAIDYVRKIIPILLEFNPISGSQYRRTWFVSWLTYLRSYLSSFQILKANSDSQAIEILSKGYQLLQERASKISDEKYRQSYLNNIPWHREILNLWESEHSRKS
jgi:hypothetical protein